MRKRQTARALQVKREKDTAAASARARLKKVAKHKYGFKDKLKK